MSTIKKILSLLTPRERRKGYLIFFMIILMALLDAVGVASIMPFMAVLGNPEVVETNRYLVFIYDFFGFTDPNRFLFFLGLLVFLALVTSILFKGLTQLAFLRFTHMRNHSLSSRLFLGYLGRPYIWFLNRHSADLGKSILSEVGQVINGVLIQMMKLMATGMAALFLIVLLIIVDPVLALTVAVILGGSYVLIYVTVRKYLSRIGKDRVLANKERFRIAQEALGGIKEVKIFGRERYFYSRFLNPSKRFARNQANNSIAGQIPQHLMEIIAFGGILLITLHLFKNHRDFNQILPILAVYAFAGYRLMPALQNFYQHLSKLRFSLPALDLLYDDIRGCQNYEEDEDENEETDDTTTDARKTVSPLVPKKSINMEDVTFTYPGSDQPALQNLTIDIPVRTTVGLVGATGSGKTTAVDIILGLLRPQSGRLLVDGEPIFSEKPAPGDSSTTRSQESLDGGDKGTKESHSLQSGLSHTSLRSWQRALGYVPQHIYLADDTVAANIAFGIPPQKIDMDAVIRAAKIAELHDFVKNDLPKGYDTMVGERGVRLSGGQIQRIGIARALCHDPAVLVFDEATSALDNVTEKLVMSSINKMSGERTIVLIAHRLSTVKDCDKIYFLEDGLLKAQGSYDELLNVSEEFRRMTETTGGAETE